MSKLMSLKEWFKVTQNQNKASDYFGTNFSAKGKTVETKTVTNLTIAEVLRDMRVVSVPKSTEKIKALVEEINSKFKEYLELAEALGNKEVVENGIKEQILKLISEHNPNTEELKWLHKQYGFQELQLKLSESENAEICADICQRLGLKIYNYQKVWKFLQEECNRINATQRLQVYVKPIWVSFKPIGIGGGIVRYTKPVPIEAIRMMTDITKCFKNTVDENTDRLQFYINDYEVRNPDPFLAFSVKLGRRDFEKDLHIVYHWDEPNFNLD